MTIEEFKTKLHTELTLAEKFELVQYYITSVAPTKDIIVADNYGRLTKLNLSNVKIISGSGNDELALNEVINKLKTHY